VIKGGKVKTKLVCIFYYNKYMGGIDLKNQLLQPYLLERKSSSKRYIKLFQRLLNKAVLNSMTVYQENTGRRIEQLLYRVQLVEGLFVKYENVTEHKIPGRHLTDSTVLLLTERHFIQKIPPTKKKS
jgi:hypothetical protein